MERPASCRPFAFERRNIVNVSVRYGAKAQRPTAGALPHIMVRPARRAMPGVLSPHCPRIMVKPANGTIANRMADAADNARTP